MKRGDSGLSLLVAVNKPSGMSSHDVVNRCRRIFGERRVGHTGTLDPLASGVLPVCIGPATRLDAYLTGHDKRYRARVGFGFETTTDDAAGDVTERASVPSYLHDENFARDFLSKRLGAHDQVPPAYSAIKVGGAKSYEVARRGGSMQLQPRRVQVYAADLVGMAQRDDGVFEWTVDFHVSKGTYIRSLARDMGRDLMCPAHLAALERTACGRIAASDCVTLDALERRGTDAAIDPVRALGMRFAFGDACERRIESGAALGAEALSLYEPLPPDRDGSGCACTSGICASADEPMDGETACVIVANRLKALYRFHADSQAWKTACLFSTPIYRG